MSATRRVLVALDESDASRRAAEFVNSFFADPSFDVLALNVAPVRIPWYPGEMAWGVAAPYAFPTAAAPTQEAYEQAEARGRETIAGSGVDEDGTVVDFGDPVDVIRAVASDRRVDLVVVGTGEKGWWRRLLEGSVSEQLVREADCPVLVVH